MGFRDFKGFNSAILAHFSISIFYGGTMPLAKYYLNESFLVASLGGKSSYLWQSLLGGCNLLPLGLRHCIDNDLSTNIWPDKQIPSLSGFALSPSFFLEEGKAKQQSSLTLINVVGEQTEFDICSFIMKLRQFFKFCSISLGRWQIDLELHFSWYLCTAESSYKVGMNFTRNHNSNASPSNMHHDYRLWNYFHKIPMQPKFKMFL